MRSWTQLTTEEKSTFCRIALEPRRHMAPELIERLGKVKLEMFLRPLEQSEIKDANDVLDAAAGHRLDHGNRRN